MIDFNLMNDEELTRSIQQNENAEQCLSVLIDRHSGLCIDMINGYVSKSKNETLRLELIREKDYQIYNTALKFDPNRGSKFSTYLGNEIKWKCLNIYNTNKRRKTVQVEEELINYFSYGCPTQDDQDSSEIFNHIIAQANDHPDKRIAKIFTLRYIEGKKNNVMPWKNISEDLEMSIQGCINLHNSALAQFKNKIRKEIQDDE